MKKYIVDILDQQTITGNLRINGNLTVSPDGTHSVGTYRALMTQISLSGNSLFSFSGALIPGETYTITSYNAGDDFSNIGEVVSGTMNTTGCVFVATASTPPLSWYYSSQLTSAGNLQVEVLENTLGFDIEWIHEQNLSGPGLYIGNKTSGLGFVHNDFKRSEVSCMISQTNLLLGGPPVGPVTQFIGPATLTDKDDSIFIYSFDYDSFSGVNNWLFYTPIEIKIKQNLDTTPIIVEGVVVDSYPFGSVSIRLFDNGVDTTSVYCDDTSSVIDDEDLIIRLNTDTGTNFLGTFTFSGGSVLLEMPTNLKKQFSEGDGTLTIEVYAD